MHGKNNLQNTEDEEDEPKAIKRHNMILFEERIPKLGSKRSRSSKELREIFGLKNEVWRVELQKAHRFILRYSMGLKRISLKISNYALGLSLQIMSSSMYKVNAYIRLNIPQKDIKLTTYSFQKDLTKNIKVIIGSVIAKMSPFEIRIPSVYKKSTKKMA